MSQQKQNKYKKTDEETNAEFVARIVLGDSIAMQADEIRSRADSRVWRTRANKALTKEQVQAHACEAVKQGLLCKWKDPEAKRMVYAPCDLMPTWAEEKPIPAYTKGKGYSRTVEEPVVEITQTQFSKIDNREPFMLEVLASYHMISIDEIKERISNRITTARVDKDSDFARRVFNILKELVA